MDEFYGGNVIGYSIEPTSDKGLHRYIDFYSMLPGHIRNRPDLMKVIYLFQDYLNDGYRKIPTPTVVQSYKSTESCSPSTVSTSYTEIRRPYNHTPAMYKKALSSALDYSNTGNDPIEEYYKERDIDTWAIDFDVMDAYKEENSKTLLGDSGSLYSYYNEPKQYYSTAEFYNKLENAYSSNAKSNEAFYGLFMYISTITKNPSISLDETAMSLEALRSLIPSYGNSPEILFTYYACDGVSFLSDFAGFAGNTAVKFSVESRKVPLYYGVSDYTDYNKKPPFVADSVTFDELEIDPLYTSSFRVTFGLEAVANVESLNSVLDLIDQSPIGTFAMTVYPTSLIDVALFSSNEVPCIASSLLVIKKYQHPEVFYDRFSSENQYRHDPKGASIAEKIYRMAYSKDPKVFDYEYLRLVAQHFGYSIETDEQEINQNSYYKTKDEKEKVLRNLIDNMPEYNRMKGTDSGIEMVLLSFGLVGRIVTLFTRGDSKVDGYVEFIDGRLISGDMDEFIDANNIEGASDDEVSTEMSNQFKGHALLSGTSIYDWYASPHFRVEFDILKDYLNIARSSTQFSTIAKTIRRIKPINTVFQGFYAKLTAEYGTLFINPPLGMNRVKQVLHVGTGCEFRDNWSEQCALELVHDS